MDEKVIILCELLRVLNKHLLKSPSPQPPTSLQSLTFPSPCPLISNLGVSFGEHTPEIRLQGHRWLTAFWVPCPLQPTSFALPRCNSIVRSKAPVLQSHSKTSHSLPRELFYTIKSFTKSKIILFTFSEFCFHKVFSKHAKATECLVGHDMLR